MVAWYDARSSPIRGLAVDVRDLPLVNALLNSVATILLVIAYVAIRRGDIERHKRFMLSATAVSALFLTSYLIYHGAVGSVRFTHEGLARTVYFVILVPHVILAAVQVPLIVTVLVFALRGSFVRHKRLARVTWPIWIFVSVTGVLVYLMLYVWFPSAELAGR